MKDKDPETILETTSKLGYPVYLSKGTWETKIIVDHPQMAGEIKKVKKTLEDPDAIYVDTNFNETHNYYREHGSVRLNPFGKHLKVSVDYQLGRIKSSYTLSKYGNEGSEIYKNVKSE